MQSLRDQSGNAGAAFGVYAALARASAARAVALSAQMRMLAGRLASAESEEALARAVLEARVARFRPRLLSLYRLTHRSPLEVLLPAEDLGALAWRARALSSLVRSDLAALDEMRSVAAFQRSRLEQLDAWKRQLGGRLVELRADAEEAATQQTELGEALQLLQAKARAAGTVLAELARSRAQLPGCCLGARGARAHRVRRAPGEAAAARARATSRSASGGWCTPSSTPSPCRRGSTSAPPPGAPVKALAPATVAWTGWLGGYGNLLVLDHGDGYHTIYAHLAEVLRPPGTHVFPGEVVGTVGDTGSLKGAYLYFEVRRRGLAVDPLPWVGAAMAARGP